MIKAVLFNMNGVIYNSTPFIWKARNKYLERFGVQTTKEDVSSWVGQSLRDQIVLMNKKFNISLDFDDFSVETRRITKELMRDSMQPNPGVRALINDLQQHNLKLGIATHFYKKMLEEDLALMGLLDKFPINTTVEELEKHKPHPEVLIKEAEKLGVKPEECVMFDDGLDGIKAAKEIGMKSIAVISQFHSGEDFSNADLVVNSLEELNAEKIMGLRQ